MAEATLRPICANQTEEIMASSDVGADLPTGAVFRCARFLDVCRVMLAAIDEINHPAQNRDGKVDLQKSARRMSISQSWVVGESYMDFSVMIAAVNETARALHLTE